LSKLKVEDKMEDDRFDKIELALPFKAEYVSTARLIVSSIANRVGFDIDTVEDIKVAVSEVCSKIVSVGSKDAQSYKLVFHAGDQGLQVAFNCDDASLRCIFDEDDQLGVSIINALMDEVQFCSETGEILTMSKNLEGDI